VRNRRGFTIVEVLVTVLLLSVGLLALATTAALTTRMITAGHRLAELEALASHHLAAFQSRPCGALQGGELVEGPFTLAWAPHRLSGSLAHLTMRVTVQSGGRTRNATLSATHAC
jgi:prepilin-type N-terminal cleavage/methylation domain-containing protein